MLHDSALLSGSDQPLALRDFAEWRSRQAAEPEPIVPGGHAYMHPGEFSEYLDDVRRVAKPLADCEGAAVRLDIPQLWSETKRRQLTRVLDGLRSGDLPVWIRPDRSGLARFYVGTRVVRLLRRSATRSPKRPLAQQLSLPF